MTEHKCHECGKPDTETRLQKCPICFRYFCEDHSHDQSGVVFCSKGCAQYFFFAEPDD